MHIDKLMTEPYPKHTCSVPSPLPGTSKWRKYGVGTEQVYSG